jgi:hypothetical protein
MSMLVELPLGSYPSQLPPSSADGSGYDFATACRMMWFSQLAYETADPRKIDTVLGAWKLTRTRLLKSSISGPLPLADTRGIIVHGPEGTVVAFAGTDPLVPANWLTDFNTLPTPDDMHAGFENAVKAVWSQLRSAVLERDDAQRPLLFTGHSLGGALAVVAAKLLWRDALSDIDSIYTFGMPRCGGRRFAEEYEHELGPKTYRLVHGDDIVATVPPSSFGFHHVGRLLSCAHGSNFERSDLPGQSEGPSFSSAVFKGIRDMLHAVIIGDLPAATQPGRLGEAFRFLPPGIGDHIPARYLAALGFKL